MRSAPPAARAGRDGAGGPLRAFASSIGLLVCLAGSATAATYYVDNQSGACNNAGAGTEAQPYCTISAAVAAHNGADVTIIVKPGIYREQVTIPASGTAGHPFVIQAQGPGVIVDGADDFSNSALWTAAGGTVWRASSVTWAALQVFVDGARLTPSTSSPAALPANAFVYVAGDGLYVNLGGANPGTRQTRVGRRSYGFNVFTKSFVTVDGFEITRHESRGINVQTGCTDLVFSRNRITFANSYGMQTNGGTRIEISGNVASDNNLHGIGVTAGSTGCVIRDNESFRNADPAIRRANGIYLHGSTGNTLSGNRVHDNQDSGMQFSGGANDNIAFNNRSWNNGDHGYDHLGSTGNYHTNDLAFGNFKDGFSVEGNSPNTKLYNCIGVDNGLTTNEFNLWVDLESSVGFVSNHNIFWNSTAQPPFKYIATIYASIIDYRAASGQDAASFQANPRFTNGPAGNFLPLAGSPAIDAANSGVPSWPSTDALGTTRKDDTATANTGLGPMAFSDIGPIEFVPAPPPPPPPAGRPPVVVSPGTVRASSGATVTFTVTASDPDGDAITSLVMVPRNLPPNHGATLTVSADKKTGTFRWATGTSKGNFLVDFVASNTLADTSTTQIQLKAKGGRKGAVEAEEEGAVGEIALSNGFPNPSRGAVEFALDLPRESQVEWAVFDLQGRMVWSESRTMSAGRATLRWDGTTPRGQAPTGVYLVRASVDGELFNRRVVRF